MGSASYLIRLDRKSALSYAVFLLIALFASFYYARLRWSLNVLNPPDLLFGQLAGTADKAYQARALVPWLVGLIEGMFARPWFIKSVYDWFWLAEAASTFALVIAFSCYVSMILKDRVLGFIMSFVLMYAMLFNYIYPRMDLPIEYPYYFPALLRFKDYYAYFYPCDTPSVMFTTVGMILLYRRNLPLFYIVLAVASLNKETSFLLAFIYLATGLGKERPGRLAFNFISQLLVVFFIRALLYALYSANPGEVLSGLTIMDNLDVLSNPRAYPYLLSSFGFILIPTLMCYRLIGDGFVRMALLTIIPFMITILIIGRLEELSSYGEIVPVVMGAFVCVVKGLHQRACKRLRGHIKEYRNGAEVSDFKAQGLTGLLTDKKMLMALTVFILAAIAFSYNYANLRWALNGLQPYASIEDSLYGTAYKLYQVRALVPWLVGLIEGVFARPWFIKHVYDWFWLAEAVSTFALVIAFSCYVSMILKDRVLGFIMSFVLVYAMQFNFLLPRLGYPLEYPDYLPALKYHPYINLYYPFDTPSMLFITMGLVLLYKRKWVPYYFLFALATFNRESTCFLTLIYFFTAFRKDRHRTVAFHCAVQLAVWVIVKYYLYRLYAGNPGPPMQYGVSANLEILSSPANYYFLFSTMGYLWLPVILFYRHVRNDFVRKALLVAVPYMAGLFFVGQFVELRDYVDLLPIVISALVLIIRERFVDIAHVAPR
jgi:hypothetical protein